MIVWNKEKSFRVNVIAIIKDYIPYRYNFLSNKHHVELANQLIAALEKGRRDISDYGIYNLMKTLQKTFDDNEKGEFKKQVDYCVIEMEKNSVICKGTDVIQQIYAGLTGTH